MRPRTDWILTHPADGTQLLLIPGGAFVAGGPEHYESECEPFTIELPSFYLALTPVTNVQYSGFIRATGHTTPRCHRAGLPAEPVWNEDGSIPEGLEEHPVTGVRWSDAQAYCEWAGLRLPTEIEWEKGARGIDGRLFPWGDVWDSTRCRHDENRQNEITCRVWQHGDGASPWGLYQMSGNIWEWCADAFEKGAYRRYRKGDLSPPPAGTERVARGGSWFNVLPECFRGSFRHHFGADEADRQYGFRVARDVTP